MKKQLLSRAMVCMLAMLLVLVLVFPTTASAATQSYSIISADFDIALSKNGDAVVTETWVVDFKSGDFTRFYKQVYRGSDLKDYEGADYAEFFYFYIDGAQIPQTDDAVSRPDKTWIVLEKNDELEMNWFLNVHSPCKVEFKCRYVLGNTVHELADGNAVFGYRVVGAKFDKQIGTTTVTVHLPGASQQIKNYSSLFTVETGEKSISLRQGSHSGLQKVIVTMDRSLFDDVPAIKTAETSFKENTNSAKKNEIRGTLITAAMCIFYAGIVYWIVSAVRKSKVKREKALAEEKAKREAFEQKLESNPNLIHERLQELKEAGITPMNLACTISNVANSGTILLVGMLCEMVNEGLASIDEQEIRVQASDLPDRKDYLQIRNLMESSFPHEKRDNMLVFDIQTVSKMMESMDKKSDVFTKLDSLKDAMTVHIPDDQLAAGQDVLDYFRYMTFRSDLNNVLQLIKENGEVDPLLLVGVFFGVTAHCENDQPLENLAYQCVRIRDARAPRTSGSSGSDSGCGGCSSCSSCSGCGGGGAD